MDDYFISWDDIFDRVDLHTCFRTLPNGDIELGGYSIRHKRDGTTLKSEPTWNMRISGGNAQTAEMARGLMEEIK